MPTARFIPVRLDPAHPGFPPAPVARRRLPSAAAPRMRTLLVLSSRPVDLAAETGLFELVARLNDRVAFTIRIDADDPANVDLTRACAARFAIPVEVGPASDLQALLRRDAWDLVETCGWLAPPILEIVLAEIADRALIVASAFDPNPAATDPHLVHRADAVLCPTAEARHAIQRDLAPGRNHCYHLDEGTCPAPADWDALAVQKWQIYAATWFTRHYLDRPFQGPRRLLPTTD